MHGRKKSLPVFIIFISISLILVIFSNQGWLNDFTIIIQKMVTPLQKSSYSIFHKEDKGELEKLKNENRDLRTQLVKLKALEKDNQALRDQFKTPNPSPKKLMPANIISMPALMPGISIVDNIIIDIGSSDNIKSGDNVVFKDNLIGKVAKTSPHMSVVNLLNHKDISFTAQTSNTSAVGIINGIGQDNMVLKNVLLSDELQIGDIVTTKDPPLLVIGKIVSVNKKASSLFQSAEVMSLINVTKLKIVFIVL